MNDSGADKPVRLYFPSYLQMIQNAVGTTMFRNFYIQDSDGKRRDAMDDGENSCAFFVSSILTIFKKLQGMHGTVASTIKDLEESGWQKLSANTEIIPGDVLVWGSTAYSGNEHSHIGFAIGNNRAVSTSTSQKRVAEHDITFEREKRPITALYRMPSWA